MTQEALKLSQEALAGLKDVEKQVRELVAENKALKKALAHCPDCGQLLGDAGHIHTCSPQRSESSGKPSAWVGLTDEEIETIWQSVETSDFHDCVLPFAQALETKLKEKNT